MARHAWEHIQRCVGRQRVDGLPLEVVIVVGLAIGFVQSHPHRIHNGRTEQVRLFQHCGLSLREEIYKNLVEGLGKSEARGVSDVGCKHSVFVRNLQIPAGGDEVLRGVLYRCPVVRPNVRVTADTRRRTIRWREKPQVLSYIRIYRNGTDHAVRKIGNVPAAHGIGNGELSLRCSLRLTHALIVSKEKELVLQNAPSG